jgi:thiamine kinase-like enzyme
MNGCAALEVWLKEKGLRYERFERISTRADVSGRLALKVVLDDGAQIKARWLADEGQATAWHALRMQIGSMAAFSDCLHREGRMVVEEWVKGETLPMVNPTEEILKRAAETLAEIHRLEIGPRETLSTRAELQRADSRIHSLVLHESIPPSAAKALREALQANPPAETKLGLAHADFCGENLVQNPSRGIVSIDHEWMRVGSLEFDLGRAICRWGLMGPAASAFVAAYSAAGGPASSEALPWWLLANDILASEVRVRHGWADAPTTVSRLLSRIERSSAHDDF